MTTIVIGSDLLSPNSQLYLTLGLFVLAMIIIAIVLAFLQAKLRNLERRYSKVTPLWEHVIKAASAILTHPHEWAEELDQLLREANLEPEQMMAPERYERIKVLLLDRSTADHADMREGEREAALVVLSALALARIQRGQESPLADVELVSNKPPADQTAEEKADASD